MNNSVFPVLGLDRNTVKWEQNLATLTPFENHRGIWFKREDYFAPLGYGGPNGSKMRQLIWYMNRYREGKTHVLTGASIQSPQLSMSAIGGTHFDGTVVDPTYEAKMWRWLNAQGGLSADGSTAFWIVGSAPDVNVVRPFFTHTEAV